MQPSKKVARVDTLELKSQMVKKLGPQRSELYFHSLKKFLGGQLGKEEFDRICVAALGRENIKHHNFLIRQAATGNSQTSAVSNGPVINHGMMAGARRGLMMASRERRFDRPSPLGKSPLGHQGTSEFVSAGSKAPLEVVSVEDGEEVNQAGGSPVYAQSRSPIRAPLGVPMAQNSRPLVPHPSEICYNNGELPEAQCLLKLLENKLKAEGLSVTRECADVLNSGLNVFINQMLKSCLGVAKSRGKTRMSQANRSTVAAVNGGQGQVFSSGLPGYYYQASLLDLQTAVRCNPQLLRGDFSRLGEEIAYHLLNR
uniref:Transcriptional coactivator Hfi1/Transcriptional adapter 1 n=1 Tax=Oryza brachyantha TaxID=4533 RepID=J3NEH6_ORYBR